MSVTKNLNFVGEIDKPFLLKNGGRIIGTNESDLLQIYKSVKLKGNLFLKDLSLKQNASLVISGEEMSYNFTDMYWTKTTNQVSSFFNFVASVLFKIYYLYHNIL